jgi:hypothetical protein
MPSIIKGFIVLTHNSRCDTDIPFINAGKKNEG